MPEDGRRKSAHASIETTVTKLLMSTKQLLQTLTQWSRGSVSARVVSDAYVQLGNDFKVVSKFFSHAKVDISDLGDVPMALRKVLEVALREPPSDETLNKYLPRIREIIVTLLDKLKVKQALLKSMKQENRTSGVKSPIHKKQPSITSAISLDSERSASTSRVASMVSDLHTKPVDIPKLPTEDSNKGQTDVKIDVTDSTTEVEDDTSNQRSLSSEETKEQGDALSQLKKGTNLQRRASKRYSAYHMAKLTNQSTTEAATAAALASTGITDTLNKPESGSSNRISSVQVSQQQDEGNEIPRVPSRMFYEDANDSIDNSTLTTDNHTRADDNGNGGEAVLFLSLNGKMKKCSTTLPISMTGLRLLFVERFAYSPGGDAFPDVYIQDPLHKVFYELDEHDLHVVKDGSIIELRIPSRKDNYPSINNAQILDTLKEELEKNQQVMLDKIIDIQSNISQVPVPLQEKKVSSNMVNESALREVQHELAIVRQVYRSNKNALENSVKAILEKVEKFKTMTFSANSSSNRLYMEKSQTELGEVSDNLLSKVDDLQDLIEIIRKDVADRGAQPAKKKLDSVEKELDLAKGELSKLESYINTEKPHWKKIWEAELDKVCEEQQFLTLQEDLIEDLKEDLNKAMETFELIHQCCREQEKNPSKPKRNPVLPILKPGTFNQVREQMLMAVQSLNPDYESRAEAIERAEKLWVKEREFRDEDEFRDELGNFVESSSLKKSGGVEEIERRRKEKDEENLRANFGGGLPL
ncbi:Bud site selection protein 6 [Nakaseomyces bracarensis]|uniref:Bud site selection protein 6 n=1 Tax=Nakaseomyces bracarensis TaxID=273131 RepID=A0ABR4NVA0_9SACH